ncbi:MAG TPA: ParB/RepB/Spo0J family partition protein [Terriglobia bacterium]|nr:ParB/RepB/Spo0J family partition protein [Terriglobia bacterium]
MTRKALGRGLNALLRTVETATAGLEEVAVDQIDANPFQPRRAFSADKLKELAESIRVSGLVQPVLLRRAGGRYQLIAGERRWRAARQAGLTTIPGVVREIGDRDALELALTENLLREDLNPLEAAQGYAALQQKHGLSHEEIAEHLGLDRSTVTNTLRLLRLTPEVQQMIAEGAISAGHARALLGLESTAAQLQLARLIVKQGLSVRQVENLVALRGSKPVNKKDASEAPKLDANVRAAVLEMERTLGTRVKVHGDEKRGKIEISYFSAEDLNRIYEWIVKRQ